VLVEVRVALPTRLEQPFARRHGVREAYRSVWRERESKKEGE
jgi:hypothetical protein